MASYFWVGGTGTWDGASTTHWSASSGGSSGAGPPLSTDTVTFDSGSGAAATVTFAAGAAAANITINKSDLTLTHSAGSTLSGTMTLTSGTLNTNSQNCSWSAFSSSGSVARTLTFGTSTITITSTWTTATSTALVLSVASSTITFTGTTMNLGTTGTTGLVYGTLVFSGAGAPNLNSAGFLGTITNLTRTGTAITTDQLTVSGNYTITGILTLTSNSVTNALWLTTSVPGTSRTISAGTLVTSGRIDFQDITATGTATWTTASGATFFGDCQGNSGITFTTPAPQDWQLTGSGSYGTAVNWTSRVPLPQDDVTFNKAFVGAVAITLNMPRLGRNHSFTGSTIGTSLRFLLSGTIAPFIYGNLTLISGMTTATSTVIMTLAGRGSQTVTTNTSPIGYALTVVAPGGTYTFADDLQVGTSATPRALALTVGTITASGNVSTSNFAVAVVNANGRTVNMGSGTWTLTSTGTVWNVTQATTFNPGTSTILLSDTSVTAKTFAGNGSAYGSLTLSGGGTGSVTLTGADTFTTMTIGAPKTVIFPASTTTTITSLVANGTLGNVITLQSSSPGTTWTLACSTSVSCDYLSVTDSTASGSTPFLAGLHSTLATTVNWLNTAGGLSAGGTLVEAFSAVDLVSGGVNIDTTFVEALIYADLVSGGPGIFAWLFQSQPVLPFPGITGTGSTTQSAPSRVGMTSSSSGSKLGLTKGG